MELAILVIECIILVGLGVFIWACLKLASVFGELNGMLGGMNSLFGGKPGVKK